MCPRCTQETDGIAAKLLRCRIASEALRRNMPLSQGHAHTHTHTLMPRNVEDHLAQNYFRTSSTTTRERNLQFRGAVSTGGSPLDFCFFSNIYVQFSKTSPLKSGESSEQSSGENRVKSCHVCGCHGFFSALTITLQHLKVLVDVLDIYQSRKCAINNFWTKSPRGLLG